MIPIRNKRLGTANISNPINTRPVKNTVALRNSNSTAGVRPNKKDYIDLYTCSGIGDALWALFFLFKNTSKQIRVHTLPRTKNFTSYFLGSIKNIISIDQDFSAAPTHCKDYFGLSGYSEHMRQFTYYNLKSFDQLHGNKIFMTCNQHVDYGRRLEEYLPNMEIDFKIPWNFKIDPYKRDKPYIVIITSSVEENVSQDVGKNWTPNKWNKIAKELKHRYPGIDLIWAGNNRDLNIFNGNLDKGLFSEIKPNLDARNIMNLMHGALGHIGYQNGVSHIAVYENTPTYFLTFPRLDKISYAWTQPGIENNKILYNPVFFDTFDLDHLFEWVDKLIDYPRRNFEYDI